MSQVARRLRACSLGLLLLAALAAGCSKHRSAPFDPDAGHPEDFFATHPAEFLASRESCEQCHGKDLGGGISNVSCFSAAFDDRACHPGGPGRHPSDWRSTHSVTDPAQAPACAQCHDNPDNALPPNCFNNSLCHDQRSGHPAGWRSTHTRLSPSQAASCAQCHDNPANNLAPGCFNNSLCHGQKSPHPAGWLGSHSATDPAQAPSCAQCHDNRANTLPPNCFNNSLCHGPKSNHPAGWSAPSQHGAAAKRSPGMASCTSCHGSNYAGGTSGQSCFSCHGVNAPHPRSPWRAGLTHTTTAEQNAGACLLCHRNSNPPPGAAPGCFNNTLCHPHEPGWASPDRHGAGAKDRPSPTRGFPACQSCHGRLFDGGVPGGSCYRCHVQPTPHSPAPWRGARTHVTTHTGNALVCALCHRRPSAPPSLPDGCFNDSLCHGPR